MNQGKKFQHYKKKYIELTVENRNDLKEFN